MKLKKILPYALVALTGGFAAPSHAIDATDSAPVHAKTLDNLQAAYQAEANAVHKYELYSKRAQKEGHPQIAKLFRAIAVSESVHRDNHKAVIVKLGAQPEAIRINEVQVGTTRENLKGPIEGERGESEEMYPAYLRQAAEDGMADAYRTFIYARDAEIKHLALFQKALLEIGHNPASDYYVSRFSGDIIAIEPGEYIRVD